MKKTFKNRKKPLSLLFLFLLGMGISQEVWAKDYATTITVTTEDVVSVSDLAFYENGASTLENNIQVKNGKGFILDFGEIIVEDFAGKAEKIDAHRVRIVDPGFIGFFCKDGSRYLQLRVDVNYYGVLQSSVGDAPNKIAVVKDGDSRLQNPPADGYVYLSEEEVLSVPAGKFSSIWWDGSLVGQNNFVSLFDNDEKVTSLKLVDLLGKAKVSIPGFSGEFMLRAEFYDGTSNDLSNGKPGGSSFDYITIKDDRVSPNAVIETGNHTILRFFPNPATNSTTILLPEHIKSQTLIISDTSGKVVRTLPVSHPQTTINVSDIEKGIYLVIIDHLVRKLIVQ